MHEALHLGEHQAEGLAIKPGPSAALHPLIVRRYGQHGRASTSSTARSSCPSTPTPVIVRRARRLAASPPFRSGTWPGCR